MLQKRFIANLKQMIEMGDSGQVAIAVSGGMDSMCLAAGMQHLKQNFVALIVDHCLREESSEEATKTMLYLREHAIESVILKWEHQQNPSLMRNLHKKAREARYNMMLEYCRAHGIQKLMTAHNKCDQAETVIMRILRGSGIDGISGIPKIYHLDSIDIMRPMLDFTRSEIEKIYSSFNWTQYVSDPSNENIKYERAKIRQYLNTHTTSSEFSQIVNRLSLLSENATRARDFLHKATQNAYLDVCKPGKLGAVMLNIEKFLGVDEEIALRLLVMALNQVSGHIQPPRFESLKLFYQQLHNWENWKGRTLWGCEIIFYKGAMLFIRERKAINHEPQKLFAGKNIWDNRFIITLGPNIKQHLYAKTISEERLDLGCHKKVLYTLPGVFCDEKLLFHQGMQQTENIAIHCKTAF